MKISPYIGRFRKSFSWFIGLTALLLLASPILAEGRSARGVVLILADGMGWGQVRLLLDYKRLKGEGSSLAQVMELGNTGYAFSEPKGALVAETAAAATAIATGENVENRVVAQRQDGTPLKSFLSLAAERGIKTGLVTNGRLTHGGSASFLAHAVSKDMENDIAEQIAQSETDVLLAGGGMYFPPTLEQRFRQRGFRVVLNRAALEKISGGRVLGLFAQDVLPYEIDREGCCGKTVPSLSEMTEKALSLLVPSESGFALVIHSRLVDEAAHNHDAGAVLAEMRELDRTVELVLKRVGTSALVVVVPTHETGGMGMAYSAEPLRWGGREEIGRIAGQKRSFQYALDNLWRNEKEGRSLTSELALGLIREVLAEDTSFTLEEAASVLDAYRTRAVSGSFSYSPALHALAQALAEEYLMVWGTGTHTNVPLPIFGRGPEAENLRGLQPSTRVYDVVCRALGISD